RAYKPARYTPKEGDQVVPFDQRRRLIAEHMVYSKVTSPHVPCTAGVDMTNLSRLRGEWKRSKETGGKAPSFLVGVCRATVQALHGDGALVVRPMMYLTLSYDHRVIDGVTGNGVLHRVREVIEEAKFEL